LERVEDSGVEAAAAPCAPQRLNQRLERVADRASGVPTAIWSAQRLIGVRL
jgi:hypothetical protein